MTIVDLVAGDLRRGVLRTSALTVDADLPGS